MALPDLVAYISHLCAQRGVNLYTVARRNRWPETAVVDFLQMQSVPSDKMLRDMARALDTTFDSLKHCLDR